MENNFKIKTMIYQLKTLVVRNKKNVIFQQKLFNKKVQDKNKLINDEIYSSNLML